MSSVLKTGIFSGIQAGAGFHASDLSGPDPNGLVVEFVISAEQYPVPENPDIHLQVAPNTGGVSGSCSDDQPDEDLPDNPGTFRIAASVDLTYFPFYSGSSTPTRWIDVHGFVDLPTGIRTLMTVVSSDTTYPILVSLTINYKDPGVPEDWLNPGPAIPPTNIQHIETSPSVVEPDDPNKNDQIFTWDIPPDPDNDGTIIVRDGAVIATVPAGTYTYTDTVDVGVDYTYTFFYYTGAGDGISEPTEYLLTSGGAYVEPPLEDMIMDGGINFGGAPLITMLVSPSGIYTLETGKRHDTLYERISGITSIDVKIPDPFIKSGYFPGKSIQKKKKK